MKITASEKGIEASGKIRGQKGNAGISEDGIVELGLDIKVAEIGISTDYGGSIIVGFAGQKIVWGLEGGRLLIKFGGIFEVEVEARDCVVTETKKIAGQIVASRTYPDPGCKLPEPEPKPSPTPAPPGSPITVVEVPDTDTAGWVFVNVRNYGGMQEVWPPEPGIEWIEERQIVSPVDENRPSWVGRCPFDIKTWYPFPPSHITIKKGNVLWVHPLEVRDETYKDLPGFLRPTLAVQFGASIYFTGNNRPLFLSGTFSSIRKFLRLQKEQNKILESYLNIYGFPPRLTEHLPFACIPFRGPLEKPLLLLPSPGNRPPMPETCCEALKADIEDIKTVLATKEMLAKKFVIPGELLEITTEGKKAPKPEILLNYPQAINAILLAIDRYGIGGPIAVEIKDIDKTKAGDQSSEFTYNSPTIAIQAILELLWELKGDSASRLNIQVRLAYAITRLLKIVAGIAESIKALLKITGIPFGYDKKKLPLEFDLVAAKKESKSARQRKAPKGTSQTEEELEALLPALLSDVEYELPIPIFNPEDDDIRELLVKILITLQTQSVNK